MVRITKKLLYAIEAVVDIAYNSGDSTVQANDIAARQNIPKRYLEQVLQQLVRAEILSGVRGPKGGYRLSRERRRIHLAEIFDVISAMENNDTESVEEPKISELRQKILQPLWHTIYLEMRERLEKTTIEDLCMEAEKAEIISIPRHKLDFSI